MTAAAVLDRWRVTSIYLIASAYTLLVVVAVAGQR